MQCPKCHNTDIASHGYTKYGKPRYRCKECNRTFTGGKLGDQRLFDKSLTHNQIIKRYKDKKHGKVIHYASNNKSASCGKTSILEMLTTSDKSQVTCVLCQRTKIFNQK